MDGDRERPRSADPAAQSEHPSDPGEAVPSTGDSPRTARSTDASTRTSPLSSASGAGGAPAQQSFQSIPRAASRSQAHSASFLGKSLPRSNLAMDSTDGSGPPDAAHAAGAGANHPSLTISTHRPGLKSALKVSPASPAVRGSERFIAEGAGGLPAGTPTAASGMRPPSPPARGTPKDSKDEAPWKRQSRSVIFVAPSVSQRTPSMPPHDQAFSGPVRGPHDSVASSGGRHGSRGSSGDQSMRAGSFGNPSAGNTAPFPMGSSAVPFSEPMKGGWRPPLRGAGVPVSTLGLNRPTIPEGGVAGGVGVPKSNVIQKSVIMCMDPTCNKCPPEMHALRNRKLMDKLMVQKVVPEDEDDDAFLEEDEGGGALGPLKLNQMPKLDLQDELDQEILEDAKEGEREELGPSGKVKDVERGRRRMVLRICGLRIVLRRGGSHSFWLRTYKFLTDLFVLDLHFNPNNWYMQRWNQLFGAAALLGFVFDPLFFFVFTNIYQEGSYLCLTINWTMALVFAVVISIVQFWYFLQILVTLRTAYVVPAPREHWWTGRVIRDPSGLPPGELCFQSRLIARHYVYSGGLFLDLLCILPLPQAVVFAVIPRVGADPNSTFLCLIVLLQALPRSIRLALRFASSTSKSITDSAWGQFTLNLLLYLIAAHIVGAVWYLFTVQRTQACLNQMCSATTPAGTCAQDFLYCPSGASSSFAPSVGLWATPGNYNACFPADPNGYGIFGIGVPLVAIQQFFPRYLASLYWGFQQLSTIAGNQTPSPWVPEILFILLVSCMGLLLLALLIGNMSNFLQALGRKSFEYYMNKRDVQLWMYRRNVPYRMQRRVNELLGLQWSTTQGVDDDEVIPLLSEDLQREIRRKLYGDLLKTSPLFKAMKQAVLDAFCARLKQEIYIAGTSIVKEGYPVTRLFFVLRGDVMRASNRTGLKGEDEMGTGEIVGEELLVQYMDKYSKAVEMRNIGSASSRIGSSRARETWLQSRRATLGKSIKRHSSEQELDILPTSRFTATCLGPVEGYTLEAHDVEAVCRQYWKELQDEEVQMALNRCSRARKIHFARTIQLAWRKYLRRKYRMTVKECFEATMQRQMGRLITDRKQGSLAEELEQAMRDATEGK